VSVSATDDVDAAPVCSVVGVAGGAAGNAAVTGPLSVKVKATSGTTYTVGVQCADAAGNVSSSAVPVVVAAAGDTKKPFIWFIYAKRTDVRVSGVPWEAVRLYVLAVDNVDRHPTCSITSVSGAPAGSYAITGQLTARVRALKSAGDLKRTYVMNVQCVDDAGNAASASVNVRPDGPTSYSGNSRHWRW